MALSEYEKRVLAEMEQHLRAQDPNLADKMASAIPEEDRPAPKSTLSPRRIAMGSILVAGGLGIILAGVTVGFSVLTVIFGVVGFLMMVGGILLALSSDGSSPKSKSSFGARTGNPTKPAPKRTDKQAQRRERWKNR